jgi:hypothetical protein
VRPSEVTVMDAMGMTGGSVGEGA